MQIKITNYSSYDNYTVTSGTENISNVVDKLIRLTAKITEHYAGDIFYDIKRLYECVETHKYYDCVLFFRECGVWTINYEDINRVSEHIQTWRLTHDPTNMMTTLTRVNIREV